MRSKTQSEFECVPDGDSDDVEEYNNDKSDGGIFKVTGLLLFMYSRCTDLHADHLQRKLSKLFNTTFNGEFQHLQVSENFLVPRTLASLLKGLV